jgi:hypothetical protein
MLVFLDKLQLYEGFYVKHNLFLLLIFFVIA